MLPKKPVNNRNTGFFNTKQTKTKNIMNLELIEKWFENVKEVRCLADREIYRIDLKGKFTKVNDLRYDFDFKKYQNKSSRVVLFINNKLAEIISYKDVVEPEPEKTEYPKVMLVSFDKKKWEKRVVFMKKNKYFISWNGVETIKEAKTVYETISWEFAKELPKEIIVTKEEIAKWKGCDVKQLIIK